MAENLHVLDIVEADMIEKGWSYVVSDVDPMDISAVRGLLSAIGQRLTQDEAVQPEISVIAPREKSRVLAGTTRALSFHTDNVYLDTPCRSVALFCAAKAEEGGANELVDGLAVLRNLPTGIQEELAKPKWSWAHPASHELAGPYAVLSQDTKYLRWWRMSLANKEASALVMADVFENALNTSPERQSVLMQPGDILVTDNTRFLHNRSAFIGERRVYRARFW